MDSFIKNKARAAIFAIKDYVPGKPIEEVKRELGLEDIIKLASNENPLGPSPLAKQAVAGAINDMHYYPDSNCYYLKQKLSLKMGVNTDQIMIGNGSDELLKLLAETFLEPGDEVIIPEPSFSEYEFTARVMGAKCVTVPLKNFVIDLSSTLEAITARTKIIYVCNPNNPTGTIVAADEVQEFMARVPDDIIVVYDEAYMEYNEDPGFTSGIQYVQEGRNAVVFRTFSKIYGLAALRIGYAFTTPEIAQAVAKVTEPFNVNSLAQYGACAALDDVKHVQSSQDLNSAGKRYLYEQLGNLGLEYVPTEANFVFFDTKQSGRLIFESLLLKGVIVRNCDSFGFPSFLRVTVGTDSENRRFISALQQVLETIS